MLCHVSLSSVVPVPAAFVLGHAASFLQEAFRRWPHVFSDVQDDWAIPEQFAPFWVPSDPYLEREMGSDFARQVGAAALPGDALGRILGFVAEASPG